MVVACPTSESQIDNICKVSSPPGRLEYIGKTKQSTEVFIDYAHTPDALKNVLLSVRPYVKKNLCIVFGCGGDRDKGKRPIMGKIANEYADIIYVTDDNPRNEDAKKIRRHIIDNCPNAIEVASRRNAIRKAVHYCKKGDILLIVGKGHEETQEKNNNFKHFSDKEEVFKVIGGDNWKKD